MADENPISPEWVEAARKEGYTDREIVDYLGKSSPLSEWVTTALKEGYRPTEIVEYLSPKKQEKAAEAPAKPKEEAGWGSDLKTGFYGTSQKMAATTAVRSEGEAEELRKKIELYKQGDDPEVPERFRNAYRGRQQQVPGLERQLAEAERRRDSATQEAAKDAAVLKTLPVNEPLQRFTEGNIGELLENPGAVARGLIGQSATGFVPLIAGTIAGGPAGGAIAGGLLGLSTGGGAEAIRILQKNGVDVTNAEAIKKALADPTIKAAIDEGFGTSQFIEGIVGAATGALGGMNFAAKTTAGTIAKNVGLQAAGQGGLSAGGEAAKQAFVEGGEMNLGKIAAAGIGEALFAPADAVGAAIHARHVNRTKQADEPAPGESAPDLPSTEEVGRAVMDAPSLEDAITAARELASDEQIDQYIEGARAFGNKAENDRADMLQVYRGMSEGVVQTDADGNFYFQEHDGNVSRLLPWDGRERPGYVTRATADAIRGVYGRMGIEVVFIDDANTPFDGSFDRTMPDRIFLSTKPERLAAQVAAHEVGHALLETPLPDGSNLADRVYEIIRERLTEAGRERAQELFGKSAPKREAFPDGPEGDARHAAAVERHLVREMGAEMLSELPKLESFIPDVINEVQARYGADAAKGVLQKFLANIRQAMTRLREFFFKPEEGAEYGAPPTQIQNYLTNLDELYNIGVKLYAERFGTQAEKENVALQRMRQKAVRERLLAESEAPAREVPPPTAPAGFTNGQPVAPANVTATAVDGTAGAVPVDQPAAPERPSGPPLPPTYAEAAQRAAMYRRWLAELDEQRRAEAPESAEAKALEAQIATILGKVRGNEDRLTNAARDRLEAARTALQEILDPIDDSPAMARVRRALEAEQQRMADAAAVGTPSPGMERAVRPGPSRRALRPRGGAVDVRGQAVMPAEPMVLTPPSVEVAPDALTGRLPVVPEVPVDPAVEASPSPPSPASRFEAERRAEVEAIWSDPNLVGRLQRGLPRNEQWVSEMAAERIMRRAAQEELDWYLQNGLPEDEVGSVAKFYRPEDGETPAQAFERAADRWITMEEAKAIRAWEDYDVATFDWLRAGTKIDPVLDDAFTMLENMYRGRPLEYREANDIIPFPEGPTPTPTSARPGEAAARGAPGRPGSAEGGAQPEGGGRPVGEARAAEIPPRGQAEGDGVGPLLSPRQGERPLLETREATQAELDARQRRADKELAEANMRGRKVAGRPQESAEDTPLFGGDRQKTLFSPRVRNEADAADLTRRAKELTGTTRNPREAGYIMRDGAMLDMSGRHQAVGYEYDREGRRVPAAGEPDYLAGSRVVDHREVAQELVDGEGTEAMFEFQSRSGALRIDLNAGIISATVVPTPRQLEAVVRAAREMRVRDVVVEYDDPNGRTISHANVQNITVRNLARVFNERLEGDALFSPRRERGIPREAVSIAAFKSAEDIKSHPAYREAKAGAVSSAARLVSDLVPPAQLERARLVYGRDAVFVPVVAQEATGHNAIPGALAHLYAVATNGRVQMNIRQANRAFHTGADAMERMIARPQFEGPVEAGGRYVLVDDVSVLGGTLAELAHHIQAGGGKVVGVVTLANASRSGEYAPRQGHVALIERRFGDEVRNRFGVEPAALTADEAQYLVNFRDVDALRARAANATRERERRLLSKGLRAPEAEDASVGDNGPRFSPRQTRTPEFRRWFGDSKVVDDRGEPLRLYHGTSDSVQAFDLDHPNRKDTGWLGTGVYLTNSPSLASSYSMLKRGSSGENVMPLYARMENPYRATIQDKERFMLIARRDPAAARAAADAWTAELRAKGHDGVILEYPHRERAGEARVSEYIVFDPAGVKSASGNRGTFDPGNPDISFSPRQRQPGPNAPGVGVENKNREGFVPALRVKVPDAPPPPMSATGKPITLIGQETTNGNAPAQLAAIDTVLNKFPNATRSIRDWARMEAFAFASDEVPVPPYAFIKSLNSADPAARLKKLTPGQIEDANHGFQAGREFRRAYINGELTPVTTGKLFLWSFLSRGVSPYTQESLFIDAFRGADPWLRRAAKGEWSDTATERYYLGDASERDRLADAIYKADVESYEAAKKKAAKQNKAFDKAPPERLEFDVNKDGTVNLTWSEWARTAAPKGSGQPGAGATHNLNAFGNDFLAKMSQTDSSGVSRLQHLHNMMADPNMTGQQIRREFMRFGEGVGIDNKVVSFTLLVAGHNDVMVIDRVQTRQLWDDGRFGDINLYDGQKANGQVITGTALADLSYGARGLLVYEAIERGLNGKINDIYAAVGRPQDASIGRYHWETWVAFSEQEASHGTLEAILRDAKGDDQAIASVMAKQGEYGAYEYGARYGRDVDGNPRFAYTSPSGREWTFSVPGFRAFLGEIKASGKAATRVVPANFKVTESGNAPWYERPEVDRAKIDNRAARWADRWPRGSEGSRAVLEAGAGEDLAGSPGTARPTARGTRAVADEAVGGRRLDVSGNAMFSPRQRQTDTPEFKRFFRNSKAVDADGQPLVVMHGAGRWAGITDFTVFDPSKSVDGGIWFTNDPAYANEYAGRSEKDSSDVVYKAYLSIQRPVDLHHLNKELTIRQWMNAFRKQGVDTSKIEIKMDPIFGSWGPDGPRDPKTKYQLWEVLWNSDANMNNIAQELKRQGFDGIIAPPENGNDPTKKNFWVLSPEQIKSATDNVGTFDPENPDIRFSPRQNRAPAPTFYSALERGVENLKMAKASPGQWLSTLRNMPGVKAEQMRDLGLEQWLNEQTASVTKERLLEHIRDSQIVPDEVILGEQTLVPRDHVEKTRKWLLSKPREWAKGHPVTVEEINALVDEAAVGEEAAVAAMETLRVPRRMVDPFMEASDRRQSDGPQHGDQRLPGGKNYRELLFTLPGREQEGAKGVVKFNSEEAVDDFLFGVADNQMEALDYGATEDANGNRLIVEFDGLAPDERAIFMDLAKTNGGTIEFEDGGKPAPVFRHNHWPNHSNVLAHTRFDERTGPNGERILHVAEVQSDWHQRGRKEGYRRDGQSAWDVFVDKGYTVRELEDGAWLVHDERGDPVAEGSSRQEAINEFVSRDQEGDVPGGPAQEGGVPDAPFKDSWPELVMKRVLRYAAENGFDKVTWDTGKTNADRYSLAKYVSEIHAGRNLDRTDGTQYGIEAKDRRTGEVVSSWYSAKQLPEVVGKELAERIIADLPGEGAKTYKGKDLQVGGHGMVRFYDQQIPFIVSKMVKKHGAKVEAGTINDISAEAKADPLVQRPYNEVPGGVPVHSVTITDSLRRSLVDDGQPLYSPRQKREPAPTFYSGVERAVQNAKLDKAAPGQWIGTIKNLPGVKPEEVQWLGLEDWLKSQPKTVTKQEVLDYVRANQIEVKEVLRGGDEDDMLGEAHAELQKDWIAAQTEKHEIRRDGRRWQVLDPNGDTIYDDSFATQNAAKEALLEHLIELSEDMPSNYMREDLGRPREEGVPDEAVGPARHSSWTLPGGKKYRELLLQLRPLRGDNYVSDHWDEPNVLAHVRFDERMVGNQKVLHVAEIQSDWHQTGRKQGYQTKRLELTRENLQRELESQGQTVNEDLLDAIYDEATKGEDVLFDSLNENLGLGGDGARRIVDAFFSGGFKTGVPDAPFKTTWPELAMKRVIRYAAENGYDRVTWDTGETNAERYDLRKQVQYLNIYERHDGSGYNVNGRTIDGGQILHHAPDAAKLADIVGKELAERAVNDIEAGAKFKTGEKAVRYEGDDLKIGGEGMKAFYDRQLPIIANKLGKKFGAKVEGAKLDAPLGQERASASDYEIEPAEGGFRVTGADYESPVYQTRAEAQRMLADFLAETNMERAGPRQTVDVHSLEITDAMRRAVVEDGQPLFSPRQRARAPQDQGEWNGRRFWSGAFDTRDGQILEVHPYKRAADADFHHSFYFSDGAQDAMREGTAAFFWVDRGQIQTEWREGKARADMERRIADQINIESPDEGPSFSPRMRQTDTPEFKRWFGKSVATDEDGKPLVVYRGEHGEYTGADFQSRLGSLSFGSKEAASTYATEPQRRNEWPEAPRTTPVYLKIENPIMDVRDGDPFIDLGMLADKLGEKEARRIAVKFGGYIEDTSNWAEDINGGGKYLNVKDFLEQHPERLRELYFDAYRYLDDPEEVARLKARGFDGAIHGGNGETALETEYKIFDSSQAKSAIGNSGAFDPENPDIRFSPRLRRPIGTESYTPEQRAAAERVRGVERRSAQEVLDEIRQDFGTKALREVFDPYVGIKGRDPYGYVGLRLANSSTGAVDMFNTWGPLKYEGRAYAMAGEQTGGPQKLIKDLGDDAYRFMDWVAGNRAERLKAEDRENLFSDEDIAAFKSLNQGTLDADYTLSNGRTTRSREAAYVDALRRLDQINKNARDLVVDSGLVKRGVVDELWSNPYYVPFYRQADEEGTRRFVGASSAPGMTSQTAGKKLKGGTEKLNSNLWENAFGNWAHMIDASIRNKAANEVLMQAETDGLVTRVTEADYDHKMSKAEKAEVVWTMVDGKKQYWRVDDEFTLKAISALDYVRSDSPFMGVARAAKKVLQVGVAADPKFQARNLIRDTENSVAVSPISLNVFKNLYDGARQQDVSNGVKNLFRSVLAPFGTETQQARINLDTANAIAGGATMRYAMGADQSFRGADSFLDSASKIGKFWDYFKKVGQSYTESMAFTENISRLALYKQMGEGDAPLPHDLRAFQGRDLSDFTLVGASPIIRHLVESVPYMNAWLQGLYKVGRAAADADRNVTLAVGGRVAVQVSTRLAAVMVGMVAANMALDAIYSDDPDYRNRDEHDRNTNFWFKVGGKEFRIPMGFEVAALSRMATNWIETLYSADMTAARAWKNTLQILGTQMAFNPIPQAVKPLLDIRANETRLGAPIETKAMERLRPEFRAGPETTLVNQGVSAALNKTARAIAGKNAEAFSPVQLDYLVRAYTGWLGTTALQIADAAVRGMSDEPVKPAKDSLPFWTLGMVTNDRTSERPSGFYVNLLYKQGDAIQEAWATYQDLKKRGRMDEAKAYVDANIDDLRKYQPYSRVIRLEGEINEKIKAVSESRSLTAEEKREQIKRLNAQKTRAAESVFRGTQQ